MKVRARQFNVYFALAAAMAFLCGCQTDRHRHHDEADKKIGALRVHLESTANDTGLTQGISLLRANPVQVTITRDPVLTEASIIAAKVIEAQGGFAIQIQFDESAAIMLEQYTAANPGSHLVIFGQWGDKLANGRWLAAPLITHRISNGALTFTADCSRDEADQLVLGLNNVGKKNQKTLTK